MSMCEMNRDAVLDVTASPEDVDRIVGVAARLRDRVPRLRVHIIVSAEAISGTIGAQPLEVPDGITVSVCQYGLDKQGYDRAQVRPGIETVPTAISAVIEAQLAGAAYMHI